MPLFLLLLLLLLPVNNQLERVLLDSESFPLPIFPFAICTGLTTAIRVRRNCYFFFVGVGVVAVAVMENGGDRNRLALAVDWMERSPPKIRVVTKIEKFLGAFRRYAANVTDGVFVATAIVEAGNIGQ